MPDNLPEKIREQIRKAGLPTSGDVPYEPKVSTNLRGEPVISRREVKFGPKKGKRGYEDVNGRVWVKDYAHSNVPDHWDVQIDEGKDYFRVDQNGDRI